MPVSLVERNEFVELFNNNLIEQLLSQRAMFNVEQSWNIQLLKLYPWSYFEHEKKIVSINILL